MQNVRIPLHAWVLVCDGSKALIFSNEGDAEHLDLKTLEVISQEQKPTHELGSERPGRVFQAGSAARSAVEQTDWHALGEVSFLTSIADKLDLAAQNRQFRHLVIAASPRALGTLRSKLTPRVQKLVLAEINKDLVQHETHDIERHFTHG